MLGVLISGSQMLAGMITYIYIYIVYCAVFLCTLESQKN